ncbi:MAG: SRPBCC domain-containing protein, partial [Streptosporangiales bacterium]|nr:SRPBCC domain-containing protein [Streptosporangiales bacterium]
EVVQDNRIVMSMDGPGGAPTLMNLDLAADSGGTRVTVSQTFDNSEERDQAEQGSNMLLDGLTAFLAKD